MNFLKTIIFFLAGSAIAYSQSITLDTSFNNGQSGFQEGTILSDILVQPDGKILVAGNFMSYNGVPKNRVLRLNQDGTLDTGFDVGSGPSSGVNVMAMSDSGQIYAGGNFATFNGVPIQALVRLNADGSLDDSFNIELNSTINFGAQIGDIKMLPDGKLLIGGGFTTEFSIAEPMNSLIKLNADGSIDSSFNAGFDTTKVFTSIYLQEDGNILLGGQFDVWESIMRISPTGVVDIEFSNNNDWAGTIQSFYEQPDHRILVTGALGQPAPGDSGMLIRLNPDGTVDDTFVTYPMISPQVSGFVSSVINLGGGYLMAGRMTSYGGVSGSCVFYLDNNGLVSNEYNLGAGFYNPQFLSAVTDMEVLPDGKILAAGGFRFFQSQSVNSLARLNISNLGVKDFDKQGIRVYSNLNTLNVESDEIIKSIAIYDVTGRLLYSEDNVNSGNLQIDSIQDCHMLFMDLQTTSGRHKIKVLN